MSSSPIYHTDSPLKLEQSNFLEVRKHLYLFHLVHPKDGTPLISHTWQVLAVLCLKGNELNYMFYLCFAVLRNLKGSRQSTSFTALSMVKNFSKGNIFFKLQRGW